MLIKKLKTKKSRVWALFGLGFLFWLSVLTWASITANRSVLFFDALSQTWVTENYISVIPTIRYIFEPFIGMNLTFGGSIEDAILCALIIYLLLVLIIKMMEFKQENKLSEHPLVKIFQNSMRFFNKLFFIFLISAFGILIIFFFIQGFVGLADYYNRALQTILGIELIAFFVHLGFNLYWQFIGKPLSQKNKIKKANHKLIKEFRIHWVNLVFISTLCVALCYTSWSTYIPTQEIQTDLGSNEFLFDFHVHTTASDGALSPQERVRWYLSQGIRGAAFSDHNNIQGSLTASEYVEQNNLDFKVIIAQEYTYFTKDIHLNIYGINERILPVEGIFLYQSKGFQLNVSEMIAYVKANGGYVTVNHYESIGSGPYTYEELRDWGVDGFEIVNKGGERAQTIRQFCLENALICMGGSDDHTNGELNTFTRLTLDDPSNITVDSIFKALQKNEHEVVIVRKEYQQYNAEMFDGFLRYFTNLDKFQLISWWIWSIVAFVIPFVCIKLVFSKLPVLIKTLDKTTNES